MTLALNDSMTISSCPCGSGEEFSGCCGPIIEGTPATTAEALMRARYSAFVIRRIDTFLLDTLAEEKRSEFNLREVELSARDAKGLGIDIVALIGGSPEDAEGSVEYIARFKIRDQTQIHHELATFRREDGRWVYVDGQVKPRGEPRQVIKVGRNDPCSCGSGLKFKKCCGG